MAEGRIQDITAVHRSLSRTKPLLYGGKRIPQDFRDGLKAIALGFLAQIQEAGQIGLQGVYAITLFFLRRGFAHGHATILPALRSSSSP